MRHAWAAVVSTLICALRGREADEVFFVGLLGLILSAWVEFAWALRPRMLR